MAYYDGDGIQQNWALTFNSFVFEVAKVYVDIDGNKADAKAKADAFGNDTFTAALTATWTGSFESHSDSVSISATDDPHYNPYNYY